MIEEEKQKLEEHYICLGGCEGVSKVPGVCQTPDCANSQHQLEKCGCADDLHNNFEQA